MSEIPGDLKYSRDHEWVRDDGDGLVTVGITDHAQEALGDMVYVEIPEVGAAVAAGDACAVAESVKAASDIFSPLGGEVTEVNTALADSPEAVNTEPYGDGWIFRMRLGNPGEVDGLMSAADYEAFVKDEGKD